MDETEQFRSMKYEERETLKSFAQRRECLADTLVMIAHWMRQTQDVTFAGYAANWAEANRSRNIEPMRKQWPLSGPRFIADNTSEWGSALPEA